MSENDREAQLERAKSTPKTPQRVALAIVRATRKRFALGWRHTEI
jgi:hypothetical protein